MDLIPTKEFSMTRKKFGAVLAALALVAAAYAAPAVAARGDHGRGGEKGGGHGKIRQGQTKMMFRLDSHQWAAGDTVTGTVTLLTRDGNKWAPLAHAGLSVFVDGADVGATVTDDAGQATVSWGPATDGDHNMKVRYSGDDTHKKSQRAQGFEVGEGEDEDEDEDEVEIVVPTPEPSPTV